MFPWDFTLRFEATDNDKHSSLLRYGTIGGLKQIIMLYTVFC